MFLVATIPFEVYRFGGGGEKRKKLVTQNWVAATAFHYRAFK